MKLEPLNDYLLIKPISRSKQREDATSEALAGFEFTEPDLQGVPQTGIIAFTGPGEAELKTGMKVAFNDPSPQGFRWDGNEYLRVHKSKICAIIKP